MVLAEEWHCSLYANVQSYVPTMFLHFFANRRVTNGRVPPFPKHLDKHAEAHRFRGLPRGGGRAQAPLDRQRSLLLVIVGGGLVFCLPFRQNLA